MSETGNFVCARCGSTSDQFEKSPYAGPLSEKILGGTCKSCWQEWMDASLIMLNEYRLNLLDPKHAELYDKQMLSFLGLSESEADNPNLNLRAPKPA